MGSKISVPSTTFTPLKPRSALAFFGLVPPANFLTRSGQPMLNITQLPVLQDNYIYILHDDQSQETAVIDPTLAEPVLAVLEQQHWQLNYILN